MALALAPPALAQSVDPDFKSFPVPKPVPDTVELPSDDDLTCPLIMAEGKARQAQYDAIGKARDAKPYVKGAATKTLETVASTAGAVPILGDAVGMAALMGQMETTKADAEANYGAIDRQMDWVLERMSYMHDLYRVNCVKGAK